MFKYTFINKLNFIINEENVENIFSKIGKEIDKKQGGILNIIFVNSNEIRKYNNKYREIDKITDVLSFHYFDDFSGLEDEEIAGEIIMCKEKIISQGKEFGLGTEKEFYKLLIHSILHILGYDHEQEDDYIEMRTLEEKIWKII